MSQTIFQLLSADLVVRNLFGISPTRVYPGIAPQNVRAPYAVYRINSEQPENYLETRPDMDNRLIEFTIYAQNYVKLEECTAAVRNVLETHCYVTSMLDLEPENEKDLFGKRIELSWWDERSSSS